ncbi:MAG: hypothetical protein ACD_36C00085G0004 [uncultured bacterium]|nr:MAG: hypothetical protein ACD_36C00085G0004 [uncultured bacterium]
MKHVWFLVVCVSLLIVTLSLHETWLLSLRTPLHAIYPFIHGYTPDYYYYLSLIEQGREGNFFVTTRFTSEQFPRLFVQTFYPVLGFFTPGVWTPTVYLGARIVFGFLLLIFGFMLATKLFQKSSLQLFAFTLMIIGVPLWFIQDGNIWTAGNFWRGLEPLGRITFLPHHLAANTFFIGAILLFPLWPSVFFAFLTSWTNPASGLALLFTLTFYSTLRRKFPLLIFVAAGIPLLIFSWYQNNFFPWTEYKRIEPLWRYPLDLFTYFKIMNIGGVIALISVPWVLKKRSIMWDLIVGWFFWPIVGIGFLQYFIPMSNSRYIQAAYYIPTAFLAVVWLSRKKSIFFWLILLAATSIPSFYANIKFNESMVSESSQKLATYPTKDPVTSIDWLNSYGNPDDLVVAPEWISSIIPALSNKRVMLGHPTLTYQRDKKQIDMNALYAFGDEKEVARVISDHHVSLIWTDWTLKMPETFAGFKFTPVFTNAQVTYYQVTKIP